jgi:hypothetical protein
MKFVIFFSALFLIVFSASAQIPQAFSFQGIARKVDGKVVSNSTIGLRLTIHSETAAGTVVYQELHTCLTNVLFHT